MAGLVESFATTLGWNIRERNVIVEGGSDEALFWLAGTLYFERYKTPIIGDRFSIVSAGKGNEGGVDGVNRRFNAARQIADADRGPDGGLRYHFICLYDNDHAGRRAIESACNFDRRLRRYSDLFLLHPVMPLASGADHGELHRRYEAKNAKYKGLDWEIEDLVSERLLLAFEDTDPKAIEDVQECGGRIHREFSREGKFRFHHFMNQNAKLDDLIEVIKVIRALRDYHCLPVDNIRCE